MTRSQWICALVMSLLSATTTAFAQTYAPTVTISVTLPNGRIHELTAPESRLARLTVEGTEYGFRPTIQDSSPWNRIVVTIFKMATADAPTATLGEVDLHRGAPAVESKTTPAFRVAVPKVAPPEPVDSAGQTPTR